MTQSQPVYLFGPLIYFINIKFSIPLLENLWFFTQLTSTLLTQLPQMYINNNLTLDLKNVKQMKIKPLLCVELCLVLAIFYEEDG